MRLPDVLALHPGADADSAAIGKAIAAATVQRADLLRRAFEADQVRADGLLSADEKALKASEKDAADARLAADRIDALLPRMRADLVAAQGREIVTELQAECRAYDRLRTEMARWQSDTYQRVAEMIGTGLAIENRVMTAWLTLQDSVGAAYAHQGVRDTGARFDVQPPDGHRPSALFPTWGLPG